MAHFSALLLLFIFSIVYACDFTPGIDYTCIPCGGTYSCKTTGTCIANANDVPGCSLPGGAQYWSCCESDACSVTSPFMCSYTAPPPTRPPGGGGGGSCSFEGCQSCDACQSACSCQCGGLGVFGFSCASSLGNIAATCSCWSSVLLVGGLVIGGIIIVIVCIVCLCRCCCRQQHKSEDIEAAHQQQRYFASRQGPAGAAPALTTPQGYAPLPTGVPAPPVRRGYDGEWTTFIPLFWIL